jgi:ATP-dependent helicase/nuclease subunit B
MHRMGYIGEVKSFISELMQYNITPEQLSDCMLNESFSPALSAKLKDVQIMYQKFVDFLRSGSFSSGEENSSHVQSCHITTEELLHVLAEVAEQSAILRDSVIVLDEFTGFTPVQLELLKTIMPICDEIWVSLTIDENENFYHCRGAQELFSMPKKTIKALMELAKDTNMEVLEPTIIHGGDKKRFLSFFLCFFLAI